MGHSSHGLWGLVWSEFINLNYIFGIESLIYHFWRNCNNLGWKKKKTGLVWHCFLCCNIFIYRPRIYLVLVLGALEALQCIICPQLSRRLTSDYVAMTHQVAIRCSMSLRKAACSSYKGSMWVKSRVSVSSGIESSLDTSSRNHWNSIGVHNL